MKKGPRVIAGPTNQGAKNKKKTANDNNSPGRMSQFKNFDDIPDMADALHWDVDIDDSLLKKNQTVPVYLTTNSSQPSNSRSNANNQTGWNVSRNTPHDDQCYEDDENDYDYEGDNDNQEIVFASQTSIAAHIHADNIHQGTSFRSGDNNYNIGISGDTNRSIAVKQPSQVRQQQLQQNNIGNLVASKGNAPLLPYEAEKSRKHVNNETNEKDKLYFAKEPRPVDFKPYTLSQYKLIKPKEYVEISNIKPDLNTDELVAKRANLDRIKEFSKNLKNFNQESLQQQRRLPAPMEKADMLISAKKQESGRQKALEFARNIPKPKIASSKSAGSDRYDIPGAGLNIGMEMGDDYAEDAKLQELESRHAQKRAQIDAIRRQMGI